jgi:hypothetical protein
MAIQSWQNIIETIRNGEPVTAEVANRAISQLTSRTEHLKSVQDAQDFGQALLIVDAPLRSDVLTGHAVYFDSTSNKFAPAYAEVEFKNGYFNPGGPSSVVGIVLYKDTTDSGVIVVEGWVTPQNYVGNDCTGANILDNLLIDKNDRGVLYLSTGASTAGSLASRPGVLTVPVCNVISDSHLLVRPPITSSLDSQALKFQLVAKPSAPDIVLQTLAGNDLSTPQPTSYPSDNTEVEVYFADSGGTFVNSLFTGKILKTDAPAGGPAGSRVWFKDVKTSKYMIQRLSDTGSYASVFSRATFPVNTYQIRLRLVQTPNIFWVVNSFAVGQVPSPTVSSYVPTVTTLGQQRWSLVPTFIDASLPGWLPATEQYFPDAFIPNGAVYGYNFYKDPAIAQLFPEGLIGSYVVFKNGAALPRSTALIDSNGIWWFDGLSQPPWGVVNSAALLPINNSDLSAWTYGEISQYVPPTELILAYSKLISGGTKVVTSLEPKPGSAISIQGPDGQAATSGALIIDAGFTTSSAGESAAGYNVVKEISGFKYTRGPVVERVLAGDFISVTSTNSAGQGEVTVSVDGLYSGFEIQPDVLAIDDVIVEKNASKDIFYYTFPYQKNASLLGKVMLPNYAPSTPYKLELIVTLAALHTSGAQNFPNLYLQFTKTPLLTSINERAPIANLMPISRTIDAYGGTIVAQSYMQLRIPVSSTTETTTFDPNTIVYFKLSRLASETTYPAGVGLMALKVRAYT